MSGGNWQGRDANANRNTTSWQGYPSGQNNNWQAAETTTHFYSSSETGQLCWECWLSGTLKICSPGTIRKAELIYVCFQKPFIYLFFSIMVHCGLIIIQFNS